MKLFYNYKKAQNRLQQTKIKKMRIKKHLREKMSFIRLFDICAFAWLCFYAFRAFRAFSVFSAFSVCKILL